MPESETKLIVISAPSGGGKTTLCQRLLRDFPQLTLSISSTTRPPRKNEVHGKDYFFISQEEFKRQAHAGRFAEWALVHGNYYGTSKDVIDQAFSQWKSVLLDIDVQGAQSLREAYPGRCHSVFVAPPSLDELEARLRARGTDTEETIQKRLRNAQLELTKSGEFEATIINDNLDRAYEELKNQVGKWLSTNKQP